MPPPTTLPFLRWKRAGEGKRESTCGRFAFYRDRESERWSVYYSPTGAGRKWIDAGTWSQVFETARQRAGKDAVEPREPDGFCVWCQKALFEGDKTYTMPGTREVHCTKACADDHRANL